MSAPDRRRPITAVVVGGLAPAGEGRVLRQVAALAAAGLPVTSPPRHRPHLTLGATRLTEDELPKLVAVVDAAAFTLRAVDLRLDHLGIFPSGGVLWLGPRPDPALTDLQARVDAALADSGWRRAFEDHHHPDHWVAHVTLATRLGADQLGRAVRLAAAAVRDTAAPDLVTRLDRLAVILVGGDGEVAAFPLG